MLLRKSLTAVISGAGLGDDAEVVAADETEEDGYSGMVILRITPGAQVADPCQRLAEKSNKLAWQLLRKPRAITKTTGQQTMTADDGN